MTNTIGTTGTMHETVDTVLLLLTMLGEFGIVYAILFEVGSGRLERFLDQADSKKNRKERAKLYQAFIECESIAGKSRREVFNEKLLTKEFEEVRALSERLISVLDRLANGLVHMNWLQRRLQSALRKRAICWFPHVAILVWEILGPYVMYRRTISGPKWAEFFIEYCLECSKEMFKQWKTIPRSDWKLVIKDHSDSGRADYVLTEQRLQEIQRELKDLLHRR